MDFIMTEYSDAWCIGVGCVDSGERVSQTEGIPQKFQVFNVLQRLISNKRLHRLSSRPSNMAWSLVQHRRASNN
ncbi:hypothetical protein TNCV_660561 [Trichonephila clavipes]|nr:hypothetical protein TNCV_660561 [Trichonephila clavipes]